MASSSSSMSTGTKLAIAAGVVVAAAAVGTAIVCKKRKDNKPTASAAGCVTGTCCGAASTLPAALIEVVQEWIKFDPDAKSLAEVKRLCEAGDEAALTKLFLPRISFGTAGLRSRMAPGYANMNELVIIQTTQGLARYMLSQNPSATTQGVVIGYDGRHNSRKFAEITAAVFLSVNIPVHLFDRLTCTPLVPYGVLQLKAAGGVMVTASHNPKDDNGYKVYWSNGAQIIPPHDVGIASAIMANREPWHKYAFDATHTLLTNPSTKLIDSYMSSIPQYSNHLSENADAKIRITYTAMHGVGAYYVTKALAAFNLPAYIPVEQQVVPDPEFPTVAFPNPEEGKGALKLAMETADREKSPLILANDPDADRLAVAERDVKESTKWNILSGNEIALLLADWVWTNYVRTNPNADKSKCVMLASTVSSQVVGAMARKEGFQFIPTLTGFKWMGNVASDVEKRGDKFLFAYEVEIGFLVGNMSLDKDGVRTAAIFYEMANQWYKRGVTLKERLDQLYQKYGYYTMTPSYFFCYSPEKITSIFKRLRTMNNGTYPDMCGEFKVASVRDATLGLDTGEADGKAKLPATPDSQMITFRFVNGTTTTVRTSGTEPKLKYYVECCDNESYVKSRALTDQMTAVIIENFLQPAVNGLVPPKTS